MNPRSLDLVRVFAKAATPIIMVLAAHALAIAVIGPGGGVAAGLAFALAPAVYLMAFGVDRLRVAMPPWVLRTLAALGVLAACGLWTAALVGEGGQVGGAARVFSAPPGVDPALVALATEAALALVVGAGLTLALESFAARAMDLEPRGR